MSISTWVILVLIPCCFGVVLAVFRLGYIEGYRAAKQGRPLIRLRDCFEADGHD